MQKKIVALLWQTYISFSTLIVAIYFVLGLGTFIGSNVAGGLERIPTSEGAIFIDQAIKHNIFVLSLIASLLSGLLSLKKEKNPSYGIVGDYKKLIFLGSLVIGGIVIPLHMHHALCPNIDETATIYCPDKSPYKSTQNKPRL